MKKLFLLCISLLLMGCDRIRVFDFRYKERLMHPHFFLLGKSVYILGGYHKKEKSRKLINLFPGMMSGSSYDYIDNYVIYKIDNEELYNKLSSQLSETGSSKLDSSIELKKYEAEKVCRTSYDFETGAHFFVKNDIVWSIPVHGGTAVHYSTDGILWQKTETVTPWPENQSSNQFKVIGDSVYFVTGTSLYLSSDMEEWKILQCPGDAEKIYDFYIYKERLFVFSNSKSAESNAVYQFQDGKIIKSDIIRVKGYFDFYLFNDSLLFRTIDYYTGDEDPNYLFRYDIDAEKWIRCDMPLLNNSSPSIEVRLLNNEVLIIRNYPKQEVWSTSDGINWEHELSNISQDEFSSLEYKEGKLSVIEANNSVHD